MIWLNGARRSESPNADARPANQAVDLLVIHSISLPPTCYANDYVEQLFHNRLNPDEHPYFKDIADLRVSAHLFIRRDGRVIQFVPLNRRAWHAGESSWQGRQACNDFSIGIELEGCDEHDFTAAQYRSLVDMSNQIQTRYPDITHDRIVGHADIAPGRKTDPGPRFQWSRYLSELA